MKTLLLIVALIAMPVSAQQTVTVWAPNTTPGKDKPIAVVPIECMKDQATMTACIEKELRK